MTTPLPRWLHHYWLGTFPWWLHHYRLWLQYYHGDYTLTICDYLTTDGDYNVTMSTTMLPWRQQCYHANHGTSGVYSVTSGVYGFCRWPDCLHWFCSVGIYQLWDGECICPLKFVCLSWITQECFHTLFIRFGFALLLLLLWNKRLRDETYSQSLDNWQNYVH